VVLQCHDYSRDNNVPPLWAITAVLPVPLGGYRLRLRNDLAASLHHKHLAVAVLFSTTRLKTLWLNVNSVLNQRLVVFNTTLVETLERNNLSDRKDKLVAFSTIHTKTL
jgi:hypothetical protein